MKKKYIALYIFIVYGILALHFIVLHPIAIFDTDDWSFIYHLRLPIPIIGAWNPIKVFPEVFMSLFSYIGAYTLYPLTGNYCFSLSVTNGLFICFMLTVYFTEFLLFIQKKIELTTLKAVCLSVIFVCLHFVITLHFGNNNVYLLYAYDMTCIYHYTLATILNVALVMHMIRIGGYNSFTDLKRIHKLTILVWTYLAIFSSLYTNIILAVYVGVELFFAFINERFNHCLRFTSFCKKYKAHILILIVWLGSMGIERTGGRAAGKVTGVLSSLKNSIFNLFGWFKSFSIIFILFVLAIVILRIKTLGFKSKKSLIKYVLAYVLTTLYILLLSAVVNSYYVRRIDVMFASIVWLLIILMILLGECLSSIKKIDTIATAFAIFMILLTIYASNTFKEINYCNIPYEQCEALVDDIISQFKEAENNGEDSIDVVVPAFDTRDNWPFGTYSSSHFEKTMYRHRIIKRRIAVRSVVPSVEKTKEFIILYF